jgi:cyclophilin family peptidyl-prolyl cis-trans isomerase
MKRNLIAAALIVSALVAAGLALAGAKPDAKIPDTDEQAPATFAARLATTRGDVIIDVTRAWAPLGADRFYTLVKTGFYTDVAFFRVLKGFMAQAGLSGRPQLNKLWRARPIKDDPVTQSNTRGMVTFAMAGPNSRTSQFFINYSNNKSLDRMGFAPFGKVRDMAAADALYNEYGEGAPNGNGPSQQSIGTQGASYLKSKFPKLDYIKTAEILP